MPQDAIDHAEICNAVGHPLDNQPYFLGVYDARLLKTYGGDSHAVQSSQIWLY